jgi:hypothetical protein
MPMAIATSNHSGQDRSRRQHGERAQAERTQEACGRGQRLPGGRPFARNTVFVGRGPVLHVFAGKAWYQLDIGAVHHQLPHDVEATA